MHKFCKVVWHVYCITLKKVYNKNSTLFKEHVIRMKFSKRAERVEQFFREGNIYRHIIITLYILFMYYYIA